MRELDMTSPILETDSDKRKEIPIASGCLDYFPNALAAVAELSHVGNEKHNKGQPLHWARGKSTDEADCLIRHFLERGTVDTDGIRHSAKVAWRALAILQKEIEAALGLPISRGSKGDEPLPPAPGGPFQVGDRVRCISEEEKIGEDYDNDCRLGDVLEVVSVSDKGFYEPSFRAEIGGYYYPQSNFVLVSREAT